MHLAYFLTATTQKNIKAFLEKAIFYREHASGSYSSIAYHLSWFLRLTFFGVFKAVIYPPFCYFLSSLTISIDRYIYFSLIVLLMSTTGSSIAFLLVSGISALEGAASAYSAIIGTMATFCGFFFLPKLIPPWFSYSYYMSFYKYSLEGLYWNEFNGRQVVFFSNSSSSAGTSIIGNSSSSIITRDAIDILQVDMNFNRWSNLMMLMIFPILFHGLALLFTMLRVNPIQRRRSISGIDMKEEQKKNESAIVGQKDTLSNIVEEKKRRGSTFFLSRSKNGSKVFPEDMMHVEEIPMSKKSASTATLFSNQQQHQSSLLAATEENYHDDNNEIESVIAESTNPAISQARRSIKASICNEALVVEGRARKPPARQQQHQHQQVEPSYKTIYGQKLLHPARINRLNNSTAKPPANRFDNNNDSILENGPRYPSTSRNNHYHTSTSGSANTTITTFASNNNNHHHSHNLITTRSINTSRSSMSSSVSGSHGGINGGGGNYHYQQHHHRRRDREASYQSVGLEQLRARVGSSASNLLNLFGGSRGI